MQISPEQKQAYQQNPQQFFTDLAAQLNVTPDQLTVTGANNRVLQGTVGKGNRQENRQELAGDSVLFGQFLDTLARPANERGPRFVISKTDAEGQKEKVFERNTKGAVTEMLVSIS